MEHNHESNEVYDDDEHDDEIESRLYEQIYYSNTIIGEENSLSTTGLNATNTSFGFQKEKNENITSNISETQIEDEINQTSSPSQDANVLLKVVEDSNIKKRLSTDEDPYKINKKRKTDDDEHNSSFRLQDNESNFLPTTSSTPISKKIKKTNDQIINPFNNQGPINSKKDKIQDESACLENTVIIVDSSSESSKDSIEDDSKYNITVAKNKKHELKYKSVESDGSSSDSEESIFEVPVPPKPKPPLIDLKDSDNDSDDDNFTGNENSKPKQKIVLQDNQESLKNKSSVNEVYEIDSDSNESVPNLVLNCSEIQKGVSSLEEIKILSSKESNKVQSEKQSSTNAQIHLVEENDTFNFKKPAEPDTQTHKKITNCTTRNEFARKSSNSKKLSLEEYFFQPMTDKMKSFYNDSWGGENFDVNVLKREMSSDPNKWAILDDDITLIGIQRKRYFGPTCSLCQKNGHKHYQCPEQRSKLPICHMCGMTGHSDFACPEKQCLTCGQRQMTFRKTCNNCQRLQCFRCHSTGHLENSCPDLWRRFHDTINAADAEVPRNLKTVMKPQHQLFCCNCAKRGHDSSVCRKLRWSQHFINPPCVTDYNGPAYDVDTLYVNDDFNDSSFNSSSGYDSENLSINDRSFDSSSGNVSRNSNKSFEYESSYKVICRIKSEKIYNPTKLKKFSVCLQKIYNPVEWEKLAQFLKAMSSSIQSEFLFEDRNPQINVRCSVPPDHFRYLRKIITQYATRNNYERSQMMLSWDRNPSVNVNRVLQKINNEMKNTNGDVKVIYENTLLLKKEIKENNHSESNLALMAQIMELASCRKKLLIILYRNGVVDGSYKQLMRLYNKMSKSDSYKSRNGKNSSLLSLKCLLQYIYYFNKVFTPYDIPSLGFIVGKYSDYNNLRSKLQNDPILLGNETNYSNDSDERELINKTFNAELSCDENSKTYVPPSQASKSNIEVSSTSSSMCEIPPLFSTNSSKVALAVSSTIRPDDQESTSCQNIDLIPPLNHVNSKKANKQEEVPLLKVGKSFIKPNPLYVEFFKCKKPYKKKMFERKFKKFIQEAKNLVLEAYKLNKAELNKHTNVLERKLKNEIYVHSKDVNFLRKQVKKHSKDKSFD